jgi:dTDP-4-dehydrorhamnose 3,5-epimerase
MRVETTPIEGLLVVNRAMRSDDRGSFSRLFAAEELASAGRPTVAVHVNTSTSIHAGTLRGIHFQYPPYAEAKLVSCTAGAIWDLGVDLRPDSPTRFQWFGTVLTPENGKSLLVPEGFGHAFITLAPNSTAVYVVSAVYAPEFESGVRFDDPKLDISWPIPPAVLSEKDQHWEPLELRLGELDGKLRGSPNNI